MSDFVESFMGCKMTVFALHQSEKLGCSITTKNMSGRAPKRLRNAVLECVEDIMQTSNTTVISSKRISMTNNMCIYIIH